MVSEIKSEFSGLVSCSTCLALCCKLEVQLIDDADEQVPAELVDTELNGRQTMKRAVDGWCLAVDRTTMKCTIYEKRPYLCREYETGSWDCREERAKQGLI